MHGLRHETELTEASLTELMMDITDASRVQTNLGNEAGKNVAFYGNKFQPKKGGKGGNGESAGRNQDSRRKGGAGKKHCKNCDTDQHDEATCWQLHPELRPEWATKAPPKKEGQTVTFLSSFKAAPDPGTGPESWLLDTGASHHMSWDRSLSPNIRRIRT